MLLSSCTSKNPGAVLHYICNSAFCEGPDWTSMWSHSRSEKQKLTHNALLRWGEDAPYSNNTCRVFQAYRQPCGGFRRVCASCPWRWSSGPPAPSSSLTSRPSSWDMWTRWCLTSGEQRPVSSCDGVTSDPWVTLILYLQWHGNGGAREMRVWTHAECVGLLRYWVWPLTPVIFNVFQWCNVAFSPAGVATMYVRYKQLHALVDADDTRLTRLNRVGFVLGCGSSLGMCVVANFQVCIQQCFLE